MLAEHGITDTYGVDLVRQIRMLSNVYETIISAGMRDDRLSGPRWRLLLHLYMADHSEQRPLSPTELSRVQNVTKNTISSHLRSLEELGLIERSLDPRDRRQFQIRISDAGRELIRTSTPAHVSHLNQLASDLSANEIDELKYLLNKLHSSLVHHGNLPDTYCPGELSHDEEKAEPLE